MLKKILKSIWFKPTALALLVSFTSYSFILPATMSSVVLKSGTPISLETSRMYSSSELSPGQMIDFKVRNDVKVEDKVVISAGTIAKGQVMRANKAKGLGKAGTIDVAIKSVAAVDGTNINLNGSVYNEGEDKQTLSIVLGILLCVLFLTMKGKEAVLPSGYAVDASVASSTDINVN